MDTPKKYLESAWNRKEHNSTFKLFFPFSSFSFFFLKLHSLTLIFEIKYCSTNPISNLFKMISLRFINNSKINLILVYLYHSKQKVEENMTQESSRKPCNERGGKRRGYYHPAFLPFPCQAPIGTKSRESFSPST